MPLYGWHQTRSQATAERCTGACLDKAIRENLPLSGVSAAGCREWCRRDAGRDVAPCRRNEVADGTLVPANQLCSARFSPLLSPFKGSFGMTDLQASLI